MKENIKILIFHKSISIVTCDGFIIIFNKLINILKMSVLFSNTVKTDKYNLHKQKFFKGLV